MASFLGGRGCGLVDRAADSGPCDPSSIPLGEKKENKRKEAGVGPFKKKKKEYSQRLRMARTLGQ